MPTAVRSHAKINLGLALGAPRPDGFHSLLTVYQTLEMHDIVTVGARPSSATSIRLSSNDKRVPTDERNTAWKIVELALGALGCPTEVDINIEKRLPVQGGLGGGSANAVAALLGLETELGILNEIRGVPLDEEMALDLEGWGTFARWRVESLQRSKLEAGRHDGWSAHRLDFAAEVGSDVPLFLVGGTVLGQDHGQVVSALPDIEPTWCVVATPAMGVSTPQAFRDWDALCAAEGLTAAASADKLNELSRAFASAFEGIPERRQGAGSSGVLFSEENLAGPNESALVRTGITSWIQNDFERVVFPQYPSLAEIKRILLGFGTPEAALHASLSGSGSALYGLYRTREMRKRLLSGFKSRSRGWKCGAR